MTTAGEGSTSGRGSQRLLMMAGLAASAAALAVAPALMPPDYSWQSHTTSESAAQALTGAWLARLGFLLFGLVVLWLATRCRSLWGPWGAGLHGAFGVLMAAAAAFSSRSWRPGEEFDATEDLLHSVAASGMGFAFACGVVAVALVDRGRTAGARTGDVVAVTASVLLPLGMTAFPEADGILQRAMFAVAYLWYAREALTATAGRGPAWAAARAPGTRAVRSGGGGPRH